MELDKISQNLILSRGKFENEKNYWVDKLQGDFLMSGFPADHKQPLLEYYESGVVSYRFSDKVCKKLTYMSRDSMQAMYMILLSGVKYLLYRYTGSDSIIVGMPVFKQSIRGQYINNVLALKSTIDDEMTFRDLLTYVKNTVSEADKNRNFPFSRVAELLGLQTGIMFKTTVLLRNIHDHESVEDIKGDTVLSFSVMEEFIELDVEYNATLFRKQTIEQIVRQLENFFDTVIKNPSIKLSEIDIVSEEERSRILFDFNDTNTKYPEDKTIQQLFEKQVERTPDNTAAGCGNKYLTYRELNAKANQLAGVLREKGIKAGSIVPIMLERSIEMLIGALSVLKSGGAYLPIDPEYPEDRVRFMLEDSGAEVLLTSDSIRNTHTFSIQTIDITDKAIYEGDASNLESASKPSDLAYIIYTSGTTGNPKGAMIEHRNVVRLLFNDRMQFDFNEKDVWTMFHSFCFDFSVWEMYGALLYGGKLVMVPKLTAQDPKQYLALLKEQKVTVLNQTPTAFYNLAEEELACEGKELCIRYVVFGGEALKPIMLRGFRSKYPEAKLINMYGITETTVHVTYKEITEREINLNISNIGKPIPTLNTYIMDRNMKLLPVGAAGELCVGGAGVGRGYLNRPELTAQKFVQNPYNPKERLYRSGDLARFLPDGEMEYLGRIDHQVKIRGHRIELGEIESQLLRHEAIKEGVILAKEDTEGNKYLCAYIVCNEALTIQELKGYLSKQLPDYMIPSYFISLPKIPLTLNGKVDRKALPEPDGSITSGEEYEAPENEIEERVALVWQEVLGLEKVGTNQKFFSLGGDSIKAIKLVSSMNKVFGTNIKIKDIYENQTIKELCSSMDMN